MVGFILIAIVATGEGKMDDTIYRQTAIKALNTEIIKRRLLDDVNDGMLDEFDTESILRKVPSAERHGRWIEFDDAYNRISGRCSVCGWESHLYEDDVVGMPYCPNCGAKMDGEQNG